MVRDIVPNTYNNENGLAAWQRRVEVLRERKFPQVTGERMNNNLVARYLPSVQPRRPTAGPLDDRLALKSTPETLERRGAMSKR
jgi:hypothetical protein